MRFTHTADCHIGGHRDPRLRLLTETAFEQFVTGSIAERVDFTIIAGDLFNTAIPGIDTLKFTVTQLNRLREHKISVYAIPGSHDYSPSGRTMLDVLEEADLLHNVCRGALTSDNKLRLSFTVDKSGVKLTGVIGRRGMLDRVLYEDLDQSIGNEPGKKIFLFHTAINELKPPELQAMESAPVSFLPPGFDYYAGGHVHIVERYQDASHRMVIYPGPLFPNSFSELERLHSGGYYLFDDGKIIRKDLLLKQVHIITIDADGIGADDVGRKLKTAVETASVKDAIVLLRIDGALRTGNPTDVDVRAAVRTLEQNGAYVVLRNTSRLSSPEFSSVEIRAEEPHMIEEALLREHSAELSITGGDGVALTRELLRLMSREPHEGEKVYEYQSRIVHESLEHIERL